MTILTRKNFIGCGIILSFSYLCILYNLTNSDTSNLRTCCDQLNFEEMYFESLVKKMQSFDYENCQDLYNFVKEL